MPSIASAAYSTCCATKTWPVRFERSRVTIGKGGGLVHNRSARAGGSPPSPSHQVIVKLIGATMSETALSVSSEVEANLHSKGVDAINLTQADIPRVMDLCHYPKSTDALKR